ncbi:hypothetical protein PY365_06085 [Roseiarcaceae bacterium H3SJ34-1]|uniref:hypothetical protein n=1 Tax=Terripilifer ovatus TaxID=3032367 RepID=UPI003AB93201|nr:hypothetical protein [Roseiarcaceae bacterium H3SJ34-1]
MRLVHFAKYSLLAAGVALGGLTGGLATAGSAAAQGWGGDFHGDRGGFRDHRGGWDRGRDWRPHRPPGWGFGPPRGPRCTIQYRVVPSPYGPVRRPFRVCF